MITIILAADSNTLYGQRSGNPTNDHRCDQITNVPAHLTFITKYNYYRKYTHAYGIPVISSYAVSDEALKRACYVVRFLLADSYKVRYYLYKVRLEVLKGFYCHVLPCHFCLHTNIALFCSFIGPN